MPMNPSYVVLDYLDAHLSQSGLPTISNRIAKLFHEVGKHQKHRAARYQRKAYSRSFRGSCRERRMAFWMWDHAINSPHPKLRSIVEEVI